MNTNPHTYVYLVYGYNDDDGRLHVTRVFAHLNDAESFVDKQNIAAGWRKYTHVEKALVISDESKSDTANFFDNMVDMLCMGSDRQIDDSIKPRLQALKGQPKNVVRDGLRTIIDDSVYCSFVSDFTLRVLMILYNKCCED